jgi:pyruvyl transferase EpsO
LPLSVAELDPGSALAAKTAEALRAPAELRAFARDADALAALEALGLAPVLAPDTAHCLVLSAPPPVAPVTRLIRRDSESLGDTAPGWDWRDLSVLRWINRLGKLAHGVTPARARLRLYDGLAVRRIAVALHHLGAGAEVETDRLHGLILATLIGRPVRIRDNATGKLSAYVAAWGDGLDTLKRPGPPEAP